MCEDKINNRLRQPKIDTLCMFQGDEKVVDVMMGRSGLVPVS